MNITENLTGFWLGRLKEWIWRVVVSDFLRLKGGIFGFEGCYFLS